MRLRCCPVSPAQRAVDPRGHRLGVETRGRRLRRALIAQRRANPDLVEGAYESLPSPDGVWAFRRGERTTVAVNLSEEPAELDDGLRLAPWQGVAQRR